MVVPPAAALLTAMAVGLVGCAPVGNFAEGGMGLPQQRAGDVYPGARREMRGTLEIAANGCFSVRQEGVSHFVIWPSGSDGSDTVRLPGGEELAPGDAVVATGAITPAAPLVADGNGYWAYAIGYCAPNADTVLVFDTVRGGER